MNEGVCKVDNFFPISGFGEVSNTNINFTSLGHPYNTCPGTCTVIAISTVTGNKNIPANIFGLHLMFVLCSLAGLVLSLYHVKFIFFISWCKTSPKKDFSESAMSSAATLTIGGAL